MFFETYKIYNVSTLYLGYLKAPKMKFSVSEYADASVKFWGARCESHAGSGFSRVVSG